MVSSQEVLEFLLTIPKGKVTTYKALAERFHTHPRAIASIMKHNSLPQKYPCYKVVAADGKLSGYSGDGGVKKKKLLLEKESISIENGKVDSSLIMH